MKSKSTPAWLCLTLAASGVFTLVTLAHYPGRGYIYLIFYVFLNALLFFGLRRRSIFFDRRAFLSAALFFDTFLGVFFWIGFWLKFSVRTVFAEGGFVKRSVTSIILRTHMTGRFWSRHAASQAC